MARESTKRPYHHGDLRNALIHAGLQVLARDGVAGLSLRKVAKEAGVSHTAPYRHFTDKDALLAAIALDGFNLLAARLQRAHEENQDDPEEMLLDAGVGYIKLAVSKPDTVRLMFGGMLQMEKVGQEAEKSRSAGVDCQDPKMAYEGLHNIVTYGQGAGAFKEGEPRDWALLLWSCVHGLAMLVSADQLRDAPQSEEEIEALTRRICRLMLQGMLK